MWGSEQLICASVTLRTKYTVTEKPNGYFSESKNWNRRVIEIDRKQHWKLWCKSRNPKSHKRFWHQRIDLAIRTIDENLDGEHEDYFKNLFESFQRRVDALIANRGDQLYEKY